MPIEKAPSDDCCPIPREGEKVCWDGKVYVVQSVESRSERPCRGVTLRLSLRRPMPSEELPPRNR